MANILVIDDQPCIRQLLSEALADEGCRVTSVGDAESDFQHAVAWTLHTTYADADMRLQVPVTTAIRKE